MELGAPDKTDFYLPDTDFKVLPEHFVKVSSVFQESVTYCLISIFRVLATTYQIKLFCKLPFFLLPTLSVR